MKKIFFLFLLFFSFFSISYANRNITIPFVENFDVDNDSDLDWTSNGASLSFEAATGWGGDGARKVIPPTSAPGGNGEYAGMGTFDFSGETRIHVRWLAYFGTNYVSTATAGGGNRQNKWLIVQDTGGTATRGMASLMHWESPSFDYSIGPCNNSTCKYENGEGSGAGDGDYYPTSSSAFKLTDWLGEWICFEYVVDAVTGDNQIYIWTQDQTFNGLYKEYEVTISAGTYNQVQILGGYFNGYHTSDANAFIRYDDLEINTSFIGPPAGFLSGGGGGAGTEMYLGVTIQ